MDRAYLRYTLEKHGISREDLIKAEGWSPTTYSRKVVNGESDWLVSEVLTLGRLGIPFGDVREIFFEP